MKPRIHKDFARRLEQACDGNPGVPQLHRGRLGWFVDQLSRHHGIDVTGETIRKWFIGETRPKPKAITALSQILKQDVAWLATGDPSVVPADNAKARNALANGAVNVVAGFIQMAGYHPAFPDESDTEADAQSIDLYAVIKGVQHKIHVCPVEVIAGKKVFRVPVESAELSLIGVIPTSAVSCEFVKLEVAEGTLRRAGSHELAVSRKWRRIESFGERI